MIRRFLGGTRGSIPIMAAFMFVPLLVVSGAGIDFMRHETMRSKLQDSLDRGVLAAASLNQTLTPEATIRGYLRSADLPSDFTLKVSEERSINRRRITADASIVVPVSLLGLAGVSDLTASARSIAEEARPKVELSLVLDVSGSMVDKKVFGTMKTAAQDFVSTVLRPDMVNVTSVNIVPFAGDVGLPKTIFEYLSTMSRPSILANEQADGNKRKPAAPANSTYKMKHQESYCFLFNSTNFAQRFPFFPDIEQTAHYSNSNYGNTFDPRRPNDTKEKWWCPQDETAITVINNDLPDLMNRVGRMKSYDGTGTHIAMKWALLLLDPIIRPYVAFATTAGSDVRISSAFRNRPANYDDRDTSKYIVLMTDGETAPQRTPNYTKPGVYPTLALRDSTASGGGGRLSEILSDTGAENQMMTFCTEAKSKRITVFTIGFKITGGKADHFYQQLEKCASSSSHFYRVENDNLDAAFKSIASAIQRIRLVRDGASS